MNDTSRVARLIAGCRCTANPLDTYNRVILRRAGYWAAQQEICAALWDPTVRTVAVQAGHSVGKSFSTAGIGLGWLGMLPRSMLVTTSPSNAQLSGVLWKEIRRARSGSPFTRQMGRMTKLPNKLDLGDGWEMLGYATNQPERFQGFHAAGGPYLLAVDEASGILDPDIWATFKSLKADKELLLSNPIRSYGHFYEVCKRGRDGDKSVRVIRIPSTASPDIDRKKSKRGLADRTFLEEMRAQYGEGSVTWKIRVEGEFADGGADALIPPAWLDRAGSAPYRAGGHRRIAVDLAGGNGGDNAVILVRDDNGILHVEASNRWTPEATASKVALIAQRFGVPPHRITYDAQFRGADFAGRLPQVGLIGCRAYYGLTPSADPRYENLRGASYFALRQRLDPERQVASAPGSRATIPQVQFAIPQADVLGRLRKELRELTHEPGKGRATHLRSKEEMKAALRFSPDYADALAMSFAFPG